MCPWWVEITQNLKNIQRKFSKKSYILNITFWGNFHWILFSVVFKYHILRELSLNFVLCGFQASNRTMENKSIFILIILPNSSIEGWQPSPSGSRRPKPEGCLTTLLELPNEFAWCLVFTDANNILHAVVQFVSEIRWQLCISDAELSSNFWHNLVWRH